MGTRDGSIIAAIIATHMPRNDAAAPGQVCPGIRIHAIDIVQPPSIGIPSTPDIDAHHAMVALVAAANSSTEIPTKTRSEARSETIRCETASDRTRPVMLTNLPCAVRTRRGG